jgi:cytochrome oxidase Cu insertion factor (SCO1/SenC/PrrC family)
MLYRKLIVYLMLALGLALGACNPAVQTINPTIVNEKEGKPSSTSGAMEERATNDMPAKEGEDDMATEEAEAMDQSAGAMESGNSDPMADTGGAGSMGSEEAMEAKAEEMPAWFLAELTNVSTGEVFTIQTLMGKVILVETMAVWCKNCLNQQGQVQQLHTQLGERDDLVTLILDIDPNEDAEMLRAYIERNGFAFTYAISPAEVSREIANLYGSQFINPPSAPMLIIDQNGEAHPLPFGVKSAAELQAAIQPFLDKGL